MSIGSSRACRHAKDRILKLLWNFVHAELLDVLDGESLWPLKKLCQSYL